MLTVLANRTYRHLFLAQVIALIGTGLATVLAALRLWPARDPDELEHVHGTLGDDDPHLAGAVPVVGGHRHSHVFVIDRHHTEWPRA